MQGSEQTPEYHQYPEQTGYPNEYFKEQCLNPELVNNSLNSDFVLIIQNQDKDVYITAEMKEEDPVDDSHQISNIGGLNNGLVVINNGLVEHIFENKEEEVHITDMQEEQALDEEELFDFDEESSESSISLDIKDQTGDTLMKPEVVYLNMKRNRTILDENFPPQETTNTNRLNVQVYNDSYNCNNCNQVFASFDFLVRHQRTSWCSLSDKPRKAHSCEKCKELFLRKDNLIRHQKCNIFCQPKSMQTKNCNEDSVNKFAMNSISINPRYTCHLCNESFAQSSGLVKHHKINHKGGTASCFCEMCQITFKTEFDLENHKCTQDAESIYFPTTSQTPLDKTPTLQNNEEDLRSETLDKESDRTDEALNIHELNESNKLESHRCVNCNTTCETEQELQDHSCLTTLDNVDKTTNTSSQNTKVDYINDKLQFHFTRTKNQTVYVCSTCKNAFKTICTLKVHQNTHSKEYKMEYIFCDSCDKVFGSKYEVKQHKTKVHSNERPYRCNVCKLGFVHELNLIRHLDTPYHILKLTEITSSILLRKRESRLANRTLKTKEQTRRSSHLMLKDPLA